MWRQTISGITWSVITYFDTVDVIRDQIWWMSFNTECSPRANLSTGRFSGVSSNPLARIGNSKLPEPVLDRIDSELETLRNQVSLSTSAGIFCCAEGHTWEVRTGKDFVVVLKNGTPVGRLSDDGGFVITKKSSDWPPKAAELFDQAKNLVWLGPSSSPEPI